MTFGDLDGEYDFSAFMSPSESNAAGQDEVLAQPSPLAGEWSAPPTIEALVQHSTSG